MWLSEGTPGVPRINQLWTWHFFLPVSNSEHNPLRVTFLEEWHSFICVPSGHCLTVNLQNLISKSQSSHRCWNIHTERLKQYTGMHNQYHQLTIDRTTAREHSSIISSRLEATWHIGINVSNTTHCNVYIHEYHLCLFQKRSNYQAYM